MAKQNKKLVSFRFSENLIDMLDRFVETKPETTKTEVVEKAISDFLKQNQSKNRANPLLDLIGFFSEEEGESVRKTIIESKIDKPIIEIK